MVTRASPVGCGSGCTALGRSLETISGTWEPRFEQLDLLADDLLDCTAAAQDVTLDVGDLPFDLEAFYELLGFPAYLAEHAAQDARTTPATS